jgi:4-amino-4-deoxy-L-arabinose transferase-like glycosyltransferase
MIDDYANTLRFSAVDGMAWLGPDSTLMPLPSWLWIANALVFSEHSLLTSVLCQCVLDSGTCVLVSALASELDSRYAWPAGLFAALNPTQIVMCCLYYPDAVFLFFVTLSLYASVRWLSEPGWGLALLTGGALGGALLSRVLIAPWAMCILFYLLAVVTAQRRIKRRHLLTLGTAALIVMMCAAPIVARNYAESGRLTLTNQTGIHYAFWVVPLVMQAKDGTPWERGGNLMRLRMEERYGPHSSDKGENARRLDQVAGEALRELGVLSIAKAWFYGAAINLGAPVATIFPPLAQLPRTGFFSMSGTTMTEKIVNFLFHSDNRIYAWAILVGIFGLILIRLIQMRGLADLLRLQDRRPAVFLLLGWVIYILLVNGPVASPKYRLPIEPVLLVAMAAGYCALRRSGSSSRKASTTGRHTIRQIAAGEEQSAQS